MELSSGKCLPPGLVLLECPQQAKIGSSHITVISSISEYFLALSKSWNVKSFTKSLKKVIKDLKLSSSSSANQKEGSSRPCTVSIYFVFVVALSSTIVFRLTFFHGQLRTNFG